MKYLKILWQLPQWMLAQWLIVIWKAEWTQDYKGILVYRTQKTYGISLGPVIIISTSYDIDLKHEYGHTRQSLMFGWLYLIVIGIPSITMNIKSSILFKLGKPDYLKNYYNRWPENWADKLGNVKR